MYNNSKEKNIEISKTRLIPGYSNISTKIDKKLLKIFLIMKNTILKKKTKNT